MRCAKSVERDRKRLLCRCIADQNGSLSREFLYDALRLKRGTIVINAAMHSRHMQTMLCFALEPRSESMGSEQHYDDDDHDDDDDVNDAIDDASTISRLHTKCQKRGQCFFCDYGHLPKGAKSSKIYFLRYLSFSRHGCAGRLREQCGIDWPTGTQKDTVGGKNNRSRALSQVSARRAEVVARRSCKKQKSTLS